MKNINDIFAGKGVNGNDKWLRVFLPICFIIVSLLGSNVFNERFSLIEFFKLVEVSLMIIITFEINWFVSKKIRDIHPGLKDLMKRFIKTYLSCYLLNFVFFVSAFYIHNLINPEQTVNVGNRLRSTATETFLISLIIVLIYEAAYSYKRLVKTEKEKEELTRIHLQSQYDSLKGQVNPHFLFNSLNSLRQLILNDQQQAADYVEQLSDVYRYLLRSNETDLTSLKKELDFVESYNHLLKTRFGNGYQPQIRVDEKYYDYRIPPLTLQLLVENAVKHNIISSSQPLVLKIAAVEGKLYVSNNLQKKSISVPSDKMGLANIIAKFKILQDERAEVIETEVEFTVILPLIKKGDNEVTNS